MKTRPLAGLFLIASLSSVQAASVTPISSELNVVTAVNISFEGEDFDTGADSQGGTTNPLQAEAESLQTRNGVSAASLGIADVAFEDAGKGTLTVDDLLVGTSDGINAGRLFAGVTFTYDFAVIGASFLTLDLSLTPLFGNSTAPDVIASLPGTTLPWVKVDFADQTASETFYLAPGSYQLEVKADNGFLGSFLGLGGAPLGYNASASFHISPVPLPATLSLLGVGLGALGWVGRARRRAA